MNSHTSAPLFQTPYRYTLSSTDGSDELPPRLPGLDPAFGRKESLLRREKLQSMGYASSAAILESSALDMRDASRPFILPEIHYGHQMVRARHRCCSSQPCPVTQPIHPSLTAPPPLAWTSASYAGSNDSEFPPAQVSGHRQNGTRATFFSLQGRLQKRYDGYGHVHRHQVVGRGPETSLMLGTRFTLKAGAQMRKGKKKAASEESVFICIGCILDCHSHVHL